MGHSGGLMQDQQIAAMLLQQRMQMTAHRKLRMLALASPHDQEVVLGGEQRLV